MGLYNEHTIDAKDKYTNGHSVRVAKYSKMIAEKMGFSEKEREDIYYMGLLHDIGKIGVANAIINKESGLNDDTYDAMTSNRSYRKYLPQDVVREEIKKNKGTQFDPDAADAMIQIMDEDTEYVLHE